MLTLAKMIRYPSDLDTLTRWSIRLAFFQYGCGALGAVSIVGACIAAIAGKPLLLDLGLLGFGLLLSAVNNGLDPVASEVDNRRYQLSTAGTD